MKNNLEKWNYYLSIIEKKTSDFINSQIHGLKIPEKYYIVYPIGKVAERTILGTTYSHYNHKGKTYFNGKKPTRKDIEEIAQYSVSEIPFTTENVWFEYSEIWDKEKGSKSTSSVKFYDLINQKALFYSIVEAELEAKKIKLQVEEEKEFRELHQKDASYNYQCNGYKFLGWQNGWKHVYFDEDGNLCSDTGKPHRSFGYLTSDYPEYGKCRDLKHRHIHVSHDQRGSENTVSCPICKIYWKYDCSD
ncbi:MAG: hypothetical protein WCT77_14705 [Bacteroidota bacterium]